MGTDADTMVVVPITCVAMIVGAVIDGWKLKVPNWLTFGMIFCGWCFWAINAESIGYFVKYSFLGAFAAGGFLIVPYLIGGMGAGDVKLYAGFGAWMTPLRWFGYENLFYAFAASVLLGGAMAMAMIFWKRTTFVNLENAKDIVADWQTSASLGEIAEKAKARKPSLTLLPYGIPLTIGSLGYIAYLAFGQMSG